MSLHQNQNMYMIYFIKLRFKEYDKKSYLRPFHKTLPISVRFYETVCSLIALYMRWSQK